MSLYTLTTADGYAFGDYVEVTLPSGKVERRYVYSDTITLYDTDVTAIQPILGDVDNDGEVTILDAIVIQQHLAGITAATYIEEAADTNEDGGISDIDTAYILRWISQLSSNDNIGKKIK